MARLSISLCLEGMDYALLTTRPLGSVPEKLHHTHLLMEGRDKWGNEWSQNVILFSGLLMTKWPLPFFYLALCFSTIYFVYQNPAIKLNE